MERNQATTQLWLTEVASGATRRLTTARAADGSPAWSPDGTRIAFTSKRGDDESPALYLLRLDGGEPERVLDLPYGVSSPRWLPDGSGLVVVTRVIPELAGKLQAADLAAKCCHNGFQTIVLGKDHPRHASRFDRLTIIAAVAPQMRRSSQWSS